MARSGRRSTDSNANGPNVSRRKFMAGVAVAGAAGAVTPQEAARAATAPQADVSETPAHRPSALRPNAHVAAAETGIPKTLAKSEGPDGSDFMVDVIKTLNIDYVCSNPASSFRALHESLIDYGGNKKPEFITCTHEESSVAMAHGYFKATGKPLMMLCHGTVGLQHATMAIYNAWCDRVPVIVIGGTDIDAAYRAPGVPTFHSAQDINAIVRDFTKWDDQPVSLQHFAQSIVRAYKIAMTPPHEPVMIALDLGLQQEADAGARAGDDLHPEIRADGAAAGRFRSGARSGAPARQCRTSGDRRRPRGAHARRHAAPRRARRSAAGAGDRPGRPHEHAQHPLSQPDGARARR